TGGAAVLLDVGGLGAAGVLLDEGEGVAAAVEGVAGVDLVDDVLAGVVEEGFPGGLAVVELLEVAGVGVVADKHALLHVVELLEVAGVGVVADKHALLLGAAGDVGELLGEADPAGGIFGTHAGADEELVAELLVQVDRLLEVLALEGDQRGVG